MKQEITTAEDSSSDIIRDASLYTACAYIYQLTIFAVGMVNKRFLGPENAGIWALFLMVMSYVSLHPLGLIDGTERQIAFYRGMGKENYARRIKDNMFGTVGLSSIT
ncbi:MAG: hypothetical protein GF307_13795, partial [candidate division Zixibacteria bacterium]|nr:hypothetical protein [candidate division Zixibacteria bacterium]